MKLILIFLIFKENAQKFSESLVSISKSLIQIDLDLYFEKFTNLSNGSRHKRAGSSSFLSSMPS